jgi:GTPase SAR1 family protein
LYEKELLKNNQDVVKQQKLVFLGEGCAGKTSFLKALTNKNFEVEHHSTVGVDLQPVEDGWYLNDLKVDHKFSISYFDNVFNFFFFLKIIIFFQIYYYFF